MNIKKINSKNKEDFGYEKVRGIILKLAFKKYQKVIVSFDDNKNCYHHWEENGKCKKCKSYIGYYIRPGFRDGHFIGVKKTKSCAGWWVELSQISKFS